jgi:hypothetical protein
MMVYLAADQTLPLIDWREDEPAFCVTALNDSDLSVKRQFSKSNIVYLGAYTGCSCGFLYGRYPLQGEEDRIDETLAQESVKRLSSYLADIVKSGDVEIFACWDGDQASEPEERLTVTPEYFGGEEFGFDEKQFLTVVSR